MKRICTLGMAALGVASIQCAQAQSVDLSKPWSVSASLRGFYDDNPNTMPDNSSAKIDSFGFEVSPTIAIALPMEQTTLAASYTYSYKWYEEEINNRDGHDTQTHTLGADLRHMFNERVSLSVRDSFVIGQEPDIIRVGNMADATRQSISGDNIRNYGAITLNAQITPIFGIEAGYANTLFDYDDDRHDVVVDGDGNPLAVISSTSGVLDRMEHAFHLDGRWQLQRDTVGILGYQFSMLCYTADEPVGVILNTPPTPNEILESDVRDYYAHYVYAGLEHSFTPDFLATLRAGARYTDYHRSPNEDTSVSPYVRATLNYAYAPESYVELGASHDRSATDQFSVSGDDITLDQDTTVAYANLTHRILPKLYGSLIGSFQYGTFNGGPLDDESQRSYAFGANLEYRFTRHVSANVGYNYDKVDSDSNVSFGDYDRNRAYIGATFIY